MNQSWWGSEFLDLEEPADLQVPEIPAKVFYDAIMLPMELVARMVDESYVVNLRKTATEKIEILKVSVAAEGLQRPGTLVTDSQRVKLQDGNHRFIVCSDLGHTEFPVRIERTDGAIKAGGIRYQEIFEILLARSYDAC